MTQESQIALDYFARRSADTLLSKNLRQAYLSVVIAIEAAERIAGAEARIATDPAGHAPVRSEARPISNSSVLTAPSETRPTSKPAGVPAVKPKP